MRRASKSRQRKEPDWKAIAIALNHRVQMAITKLQAPNESGGGGYILDANNGQTQHWRDYFADALEMIPGVRVDRELMHARTYAARKRILKEREASRGK